MQIAHIFNENKTNNNKSYIDYQPFDTNYIEQSLVSENINKKIIDNYSKLYYEALEPVENKSIISKYDEEKIHKLVDDLGEDLLMISGDFWGIQKFIFDGLTTSKAARILRSRSAMVQLFTYVVVDMIKKEFDSSDIVLFGAGKFLVLASYENDFKQRLSGIQKSLDRFFLKNFFGQTGFILSSATTTKENILKQDSIQMKKELQNLAKDNELKKLKKFSFKDLDNNQVCIDTFAQANSDDSICPFCSKRVIEKNVQGSNACSICTNQISLGNKLVKNEYMCIVKSENICKDSVVIFKNDEACYQAIFLNTKEKALQIAQEISGVLFDISDKKYDGIAKWSISSYVPTDNDGIKTFEQIAKNSSGLMALKADVDKLGDTFRDYYMNSFKKFNRLSRELDFFFSTYVSQLIAKNYPNCYVVFAGGDDLFLIGEYKEVVALAKDIRKKFYKFSLQKATLSMGLVMFKPSTPIYYVSTQADEAELRAKEVVVQKGGESRNGIDIFGISMKFDEFLEIEKSFEQVFKFLEENSKETTSFYYRLMELCDMCENIRKDPKNAMWKSKLNYLFRRNISKADNDLQIYQLLDRLIETHGQKLKPTLFLKVYANRDKNKEKSR